MLRLVGRPAQPRVEERVPFKLPSVRLRVELDVSQQKTAAAAEATAEPTAIADVICGKSSSAPQVTVEHSKLKYVSAVTSERSKLSSSHRTPTVQ